MIARTVKGCKYLLIVRIVKGCKALMIAKTVKGCKALMIARMLRAAKLNYGKDCQGLQSSRYRQDSQGYKVQTSANITLKVKAQGGCHYNR